MSDSTIPMDVQDTDDTGFDAFLSSFNDDAKKRPPESGEGAPEPQTETAAATETTEGEPEATEHDDDPDNQEFEIKVGEETKKATLRDLKRLYGQEAALTQKSQRASEQLRVAEADITRTSTLSKAMLERAQARFAPYAQIDAAQWAQFAAQLPVDQYNALREEVVAAKADVDFLTQDVQAFMKEQETKAQQAHQVAAQECVKALTDPSTGIEGFNEPLYNEMMEFCKEVGLPETRRSTSPAEYKLVHMAMLWSRHQKAAKAAEAKVKKAVEQPTRVIKPGTSGKTDGKKAAMAQLRRTGDLDDATEAFRQSF